MTDIRIAAGRPVKKKRNWYPVFFLAPYFIGLVAFSLLPVIFTFFISFTRWDGFGHMEFIGLQNYVHMLTGDDRFFKSLFNTVVMMGMSIPITLVLALVFAYILSGKAVYGKRALQTGVFLPYVTTPVAIGIIFALLFDQRYGFINQFFTMIGVMKTPVFWLGNEWTARLVLALILVWRYVGYDTVLFMAGMSMISDEIYDAAKIDGANSAQVFLRITLPMLKGILIFVIITSLIGGFQLFDEPKLLFNGSLSGNFAFGGPKNAALTLSMFFYNEAYNNFNYGFGAAISYGMFVVISIFSFISMKLMTRGDRSDG